MASLLVFLAANAVVFLVGGALTYLSYQAYQRSRRPSLRYAVLGFGIITGGALVEAIYELGIKGSHELGADELLALHSVESVLIGAGLALIFYSLQGQ